MSAILSNLQNSMYVKLNNLSTTVPNQTLTNSGRQIAGRALSIPAAVIDVTTETIASPFKAISSVAVLAQRVISVSLNILGSVFFSESRNKLSFNASRLNLDLNDAVTNVLNVPKAIILALPNLINQVVTGLINPTQIQSIAQYPAGILADNSAIKDLADQTTNKLDAAKLNEKTSLETLNNVRNSLNNDTLTALALDKEIVGLTTNLKTQEAQLNGGDVNLKGVLAKAQEAIIAILPDAPNATGEEIATSKAYNLETQTNLENATKALDAFKALPDQIKGIVDSIKEKTATSNALKVSVFNLQQEIDQATKDHAKAQVNTNTVLTELNAVKSKLALI